MTTTTTDDPIEGMRLYVDSIDCKPRNFDWSSNPREDFGDEDSQGTPWSFTEYRVPEEGDEATCAECGEDITFADDEWTHVKLTCVLTGEDGEAEDDCTTHEHEEDDHDAKPDSEYTENPEYCEGPMMSYWYPVEIRDVEAAAKAIAHLPLCVVTVDDETGLALTGGGMDLSWQICEAFIAIGAYPPFHFVSSLPKMADRWTDSHELVVAAGRKVCQIVAEWAQSAGARLDDTARWMKNREWEADNARRAAARGDV